MYKTAEQLESAINEYLPQLKGLNNEKAAVKPRPEKWSKKEIIGHLIDSAQNNLRRFIVGQYEENPLIVYRQNDWVRINNYLGADTEDLVELWRLLNRQIVMVLRNTDPALGERLCDTGDLHSIAWLANDYIKHMKHHLHQVLEKEEIPYP